MKNFCFPLSSMKTAHMPSRCAIMQLILEEQNLMALINHILKYLNIFISAQNDNPKMQCVHKKLETHNLTRCIAKTVFHIVP